MPRIDDLFDQMKGAKMFLKIDLISSYHKVRIKEEEIQKKKLWTRYEHYEFMVVLYGLTNAPTMCFMSSIFNKYLDYKFMLVLLDDIIIYSKNEEHEEHLIKVLQVLR